MRPWGLAAGFIAATLLCGGGAEAQYRLRADSYVSGSDSTTGLLVLSGEARKSSWFDAETVVWLTTVDQAADVLVASIRMRDPKGRGEAKAGRLLVSAGAIRPIHLDGVDAVGRTTWGTSLEAFGGLPVMPNDGPRDYDWVVGQRLAQRIGQYGSVGASYLQMRSTGEVAYEELGVDAAIAPTKWLNGAFALANDMVRPGIADGRVSLATRFASMRLELYASRRAPSHLLPATSLFSALSDTPSDRAGGSLLWKAAPRLDVLSEGALESVVGQFGGRVLLRATLRLDDRGDGAMGFEFRREGVADASWTGLRVTARVPLPYRFGASSELELVRPDDPRGRGSLWPWGLVALRFKPAPAWETAAAFEASSSPTYVAALRGLFRLSYAWGSK